MPRLRPLIVTLVILTAGLGLVSAGLPAATTSPLTTGTGEVRLYLDVLEENNLPTWWATSLLVAAAGACGMVGQVGRACGHRGWWRWWVLAGLMALLSLDEMTSLHERLDRLVVDRIDLGDYPFLWVVPGAMLAGGLAVVVVLVVRGAPGAARRWLLLGFGMLLGSALGGELVQGVLLGAGDTGPAYVLAYHAEEFGETVGAIALLTGALSALRADRHASGGVLVRLAAHAGDPPGQPR